MTKVRVLDGGMGRELKRIGAPFRQPEWSALALIEAPEFVERAHRAFLQAGATVLTTNSYAVVPFHIGNERFAAQGQALAALAGEIARSVAREGEGVEVAGSLPPALGSYRPDLFQEEASIAIHRTLIRGLAPFIDVWLAETQSSIAEILAVGKALADAPNDPKPLWVSFTLDDAPEGVPVLRSGEPVAQAVEAAIGLGVEAILFNCSQPEVMGAAVSVARQGIKQRAIALGVYANAFPPTPKDAKANETLDEIRADLGPEAYALRAREWVDRGASLIGGCCGITPEHISQIAREFAS